MGFALLPVIFLTFCLGVIQAERYRAENYAPNSTGSQAMQHGQMFVAYRNAVALYQQNNPAFIGTVSTANLIAQGSKFNTEFLALTGNGITATGTTGRIITCYGTLPAGSIVEALNASENDMSLGVSSGTTWKSHAQGSNQAAQILPIVVPNGSTVSVVQIGS